MSLPKINLAGRIMLGAAFLIILLSALFTGLIVNTLRNLYLSDREELMFSKAEKNLISLVSTIHEVRQNLLFLADSPTILEIVNLAQHPGNESPDDNVMSFWKNRLGDVFAEFSETHPLYYQLSFIGVADQGRELVRVDAHAGTAMVTPAPALQEVNDQEYYQKGIKTNQGEVYLSKIELKRTADGTLAESFIRSLYAVTPIFTSGGELFGLVTIHFNIGPALNAIADTHIPGLKTFLINEADDYLIHPEWNYEHQQRFTWREEMSTLKLQSNEIRNNQRMQSLTTPDGRLHVIIAKRSYDERDSRRVFYLAYGIPEDFVKAQLADFRATALLSISAIAGTLLLLVFLIVHRMFAPLRNLTTLAEGIAVGQYDHVLPEEGIGEMGTLMSAFGSMITGIETREQEIMKANSALKSSEELFRLTVAGARDYAIFLLDSEGRVANWNSGAEKIMKYRSEEIMGRKFTGFSQEASPGGYEILTNALNSAMEKGCYERDTWVTRQDGTSFWANLMITPLPAENGRRHRYTTVIRDLTTRREAEEELKRQHTMIKAIMDGTADAIFIKDYEGRYLIINKAGADLLGYRVDAIIGHSDADLIPAESAKSFRETDMMVMREGESLVREESGMIAGKSYTLMTNKTPWRDETNKVIGIIGISRDITELKLAEKALKESEQGLRAIFEQVGIGVAQIETASGRYVRVNHRYCNIVGLTMAEMTATTFMAITHHDDLQADLDKLEELKAGVITNYAMEKRLLRPDGKIIWVNQTISTMGAAGESPNFFLAVVDDITERRNAEQFANRAQRLEAIGTLAGGIAHDLNNALAPLLMGIQLLMNKVPSQSSLLETMVNSVNRAADMVRQLVTFAKGVEGVHIAINMGHLIKEIETIIRATFPKAIELRIMCSSPLPLVMADATQIHQVLLNLCVNARDAMPQGGTLTITVEVMEIDAAFLASAHAVEIKPGRYIRLLVGDTGTGIKPEIIDKIFDPFYTTKAPDKGTGLGLSTVMGIIKGHGGCVLVDSHPGVGTTFSIYLPAQGKIKTHHDLEAQPEVPFHGNGELILYVDDEAPIRLLMQELLEELNFTSLIAIDGADGLIRVAQNQADLRVIITDLHMPHMDGLVFARSVRRLLPDIPMIVASGNMDDEMMAEFRILNIHRTLDKPFTQQRITEVLRLVLTPAV